MINEVAERYAGGLFELAKENHTVESKLEQAESLLEALRLNEDLLLFLRAVKVTDEEKKACIDATFKDVLDTDMLHFLKVLVDTDRSYYLREILEEYIALADHELGIQKATVQSAKPLSSADLKRIQIALERKTKKKVLIRNTVHPELIAGIKVILGNTVTDITIKDQMDKLKETLLKGGRA